MTKVELVPVWNIAFPLDHRDSWRSRYLAGETQPLEHLQVTRASMVRYLAIRTSKTDDAVVKCPKCASSSKFCRALFPHIDTCGFESYSFRCECCGSAIGGIINPLDDRLFASLLDPGISWTSMEGPTAKNPRLGAQRASTLK